jgi:hypothetical protein
MGMLRRYSLGLSLCLAPLALSTCGVVTPDDAGLFASVASAPEGGGSAGAGGGGSTGTGGGNSTGGAPPAAQTINGANSCEDKFEIALGYGPGKNLFRGTGNTKDDNAPTNEAACQIGTNGPDRVHAITVNAPEGGYLTARLVRGDNRTDFDSVLYLRGNDCAVGLGTVCEDAFSLDRNKERLPVNGGELVSIAVPPSETPTTFYLFVDGVNADSAGRYELEVTLAKGDCLDPVPIFVEPGSPVRAVVSNQVAKNVMTHTCGNTGSVDVVFKVTRAVAGAMLVGLDTDQSDLAIAFLKAACDNKAQPTESKCAPGAGASLGEAAWPGVQQSIYVVVDASNPTQDLVVPIIFDPSGGLDFEF